MCLGHNRNLFWPCNYIAHWTIRFSYSYSPKPFFRWLCCFFCIRMSLHVNWNRLQSLWISFLDWCFTKKFFSFVRSKPESNTTFVRNSIRNNSCFSRFHLDHDFCCQNLVFDIFQEAHQSRRQNSYIFLDREHHHFVFMAIHGVRAARFVQES